ncbi:MAG: hypothetical protein IT472_03810 [Thermomonas sp.]|nr:hypothetical protein [Thermomonas sp.]
MPVFRGLVAIELREAGQAANPALSSVSAGDVAAMLGRDLAKLAPQVANCDLGLLAVHYDPAEVLRPGWPVHAVLEDLLQRLPNDGLGARMIGFGADAEGNVPEPLRADPDCAGGVLRVIPFILRGAAVAEVTEALEADLFDRGMAEADFALALQAGIGVRVEHMRYQSLHDLLAMTAMQYQHAGLEPLWTLLDAALLAPQSDCVIDQPPEPLACYAEGEVRIGLLDAAAWQQRNAAGVSDRAQLAQGFAMFEMRQRQFAAVLRAHGVPVQFVHCPEADPRHLR